MQLPTTIGALYAASAVFICMLSMICMLSIIVMVLEFIGLMIKRQPVAQALRTCVRSFVESFPAMIAEATTITLVSLLILSVI